MSRQCWRFQMRVAFQAKIALLVPRFSRSGLLSERRNRLRGLRPTKASKLEEATVEETLAYYPFHWQQ